MVGHGLTATGPGLGWGKGPRYKNKQLLGGEEKENNSFMLSFKENFQLWFNCMIIS